MTTTATTPNTTDRTLLVLIAGPYLSGTDGDPQRIAANLARMEATALPLYERGHLAMIGEWVALLVAGVVWGLSARSAPPQASCFSSPWSRS